MVVLIEGKVLFTFRRSGWFDIFMDSGEDLASFISSVQEPN
jgi:hypothetical protein